MSKTQNDGGPAFPRPLAETTGSFDRGDVGMSLRDYLAGQALAGMLAGAETPASPTDFAIAAYEFADAMLEERERK